MKKIIIFAALIFVILASISPLDGKSPKEEGMKQKKTVSTVKRHVAITIDDVPGIGENLDLQKMRNLANAFTFTITSQQIPAVAFVCEGRFPKDANLDGRLSILRMWADGGIELANHTYSHWSFRQIPLVKFEADVIRGEKLARKIFNEKEASLRYFRYPFLITPPPGVRRIFEKFLSEREYTVAPVTVDSDDYIFLPAYEKALERGDIAEINRVVNSYITHVEKSFVFSETYSTYVTGREIKQIFLLHACRLNADHLGEIIELIKKRGYEFTTLEEALSDESYRQVDGYSGSAGALALQRWAITKGLELRFGPDVPNFIRRQSNRKR